MTSLPARLFTPRACLRSKPPGVPPGEMADSAIGVTPGPLVGVRSVDARPGNLKCACAGASKEVITFNAEFLVVMRVSGALGGGDTGGLNIVEMFGGVCEGVLTARGEGEDHGIGGSTPVQEKHRMARCC